MEKFMERRNSMPARSRPNLFTIAGGRGRFSSSKISIAGRGQKPIPTSISVPVFIVDCFGDQKFFTGCTAGVVLLSRAARPKWMYRIASQLHLKQLAIVAPTQDANIFSVHYFSPKQEILLGGNAAFAAAHVLSQEHKSLKTFKLVSQNVTLTARVSMEGQLSVEYRKSQVGIIASHVIRTSLREGLIEAFDLQADQLVDVYQTEYDILLLLSSEAAVRGVAPNFEILRRFPTRGIAVTAQGSEYVHGDAVMRWFSPSTGVEEEGMDVSVVSYLAPFWADREDKSFIGITGTKAGHVDCALTDTHVVVTGHASIVVGGTLNCNAFLHAKF